MASLTRANEAAAGAVPQQCYHCGEAVPAGSDFGIAIDGVVQPMCCPGCRAVAGLITASGLQSFYRQRTAFNERPAQVPGPAANTGPPVADAWAIYDDPQLASTFTNDLGDCRRAALLLDGIRCAACTWLIEHSLQQLPGVRSAVVNLANAQLTVEFDPATTPLSEIFRRLVALGYPPRPYHPVARREQLQRERRDDLKRLGIAGLGMMQVGMFAIALHAGDIQGIEPRFQALLRWVSLPVAALVVLYSAGPFFRTAWSHLRAGSLVMDLPVALAIGLAFVASAWATVRGSGQVYFDSVVMFTFLLLLGRFLERQARNRHALAWVDALGALPAAAMRCDERGAWQPIPRQALRPGDVILVREGEIIAADAVVCAGEGLVREEAFNGESLPRRVAVGDTVFAGTLAVDSQLQAKVQAADDSSRLAAMQRSLERARAGKPRLAVMADRLASRFVAAILIIAAATAAVWWQVDPQRALWVSLSVLVISCPCALALATPAALASAASGLRKRGVLVYGDNALETLAGCTTMLFDKTGTLTGGQLTLAATHCIGPLTDTEVLGIAAALQQFSTHPVARAFSHLPAQPGFARGNYRTGAGVEATRQGTRYRIGSAGFCRELAPALPAQPADHLYWVALVADSGPLAWIGLHDSLREEAPALVAAVRAAGLQTEVVSGDSSDQGRAVAEALGMDRVATGLSPADKIDRVRALQAAGAVVAMIGDGLNDAPVLARADVSIAVAGATDLARAEADFVIDDGDLSQVTDTWATARRCRRVIRQNFAWALGYNCCAIPLAAAGLVPPWAAALGMSLSSLLVVGNSLRLNK